MNNDNLLVMGSAPSTVDFFEKQKNILLSKKSPHSTLAFQAAYPAVENLFEHTPTYWSWGDPRAAIDGLKKIKSNLENNLPAPHVIIPSFLENVDLFGEYCGTSQILSPHAAGLKNFYNTSIAELRSKGLLTTINNSTTMRKIKESNTEIPDLKERFARNKFYFHSVAFTGRGSWDISTFESKLTSLCFPTAFYLKSKNVFVLGFDHQGKGLNKTRKETYEDQYKAGTRHKSIERIYKIIEDWVGPWKPFHNMSIYSVVDSNLTRNNEYMEKFII